MDTYERAMLVAAGIALMGSVVAMSMAALQTLANPSGTIVSTEEIIVISGFFGVTGLGAFGALWLLRNNKRS